MVKSMQPDDRSAPRFLTILVEEHPALPDGCCMRFKLAGEPRPVRRLHYELPDGPGSQEWLVAGADAADGPTAALAVPVEDSGAGLSVLVYGAEHGLRLRPASGGASTAEPYLLLAAESILE
jgi:hypothetical protein